MLKKYKVVDLFAGVGGLSYGFAHNDHFKILFANEYEKDIATAYSLNHPGVTMINDDIRNLSEERILKATKGQQVDVLVGGPPCQSYSTLGKRQMDDRAWLFEEYCRILSIVKPKIFLFENVSGLLSMQGGRLIEVIKKRFHDLGYEVKIKLLNAVDYGVPQYRERVILVGMRGENHFEYPAPTHGRERAFAAMLHWRTHSPIFQRSPAVAAPRNTHPSRKMIISVIFDVILLICICCVVLFRFFFTKFVKLLDRCA